MAKKKYDIELKVNLERRFVKDNDSDQLVGSCLLQFPYGRGGLDELRTTRDGTASSTANMEEFMGHFSRLSKREFQKPMIQLMYYSMISRARLLKRSRLQVKGEKSAQDLAEGLNHEDLHTTIEQRKRGNRYGGTRVSRKLLDAVEACSRALPHTNEAAKVARTTAESMQHYMGSGSIFLTVTFDDENSLLMQVLSGIEVDDDRDISELTDKELRERRRSRREIRIQYPGVAAVHFEMLFEILVEEVVGWSMKNNCATDKPGFFGIPEAFAAAMEEQGRMTVHGHMSIWIKGYKKLQRAMFFAKSREKEAAEKILTEYHDRISSTSLMQSTTSNKIPTCLAAWDHECTREKKRQRLLPVVIVDQQLRYLRHRKGYSESKGCFANCPHCTKSWTYEELVCGYLSQGNQCVGYTKEMVDSTKSEKMEIPRHRCFAEVVRYQKNFSSDSHLEAPETAINAVYQTHRSCHVDSCFRCTKRGKKHSHVCGPSCECRYRMPDRKRKHTYIKTERTGAPWYAWNGEEKEQPIVQVCSKRNTYDLFQNISCPAVSLSKFGCNSNVQLITDGPIGQYQFKYTFKPTQDDDTKEYAGVDASIKALTGRVHENDRSEAIRRITRAAFAHNKTNVISPSFASYLTRNDSRFYFSHQFTFCPLKDVLSLHRKQKVSSVLKYSRDGTSYFENQALHYLCRPEELEELSLKAFFERYEVTYVKKRGRQSKGSNDNPIMPFIATDHFHHPSIRKGATTAKLPEAKQGVRCRQKDIWIKISQWLFPDTSYFHGEDITTCHKSCFNKTSEQYAEAAMTLLLPHRHMGDLKVDETCTFPFTRKFQLIWKKDEERRRDGVEPVLFTTENMAYLQNIQDCARNSLRYKIDADDLQAGTEPFHPTESNLDRFDTDDDNDAAEENAHYEMFLQYLDSQKQDIPDARDSDPSHLQFQLEKLTFKHLRAKGTHNCGFHARDRLPSIPEKNNENTFVKVGLPASGPTPVETPGKSRAERKKYTQQELVRALFKKTTRKPRTDILDDMQLEVSEANGSVESIREWGSQVFASDKKQRRAFETIISAFLLTFFNNINTEEDVGDTEPIRTASHFRKAKLALLRLKGERGANKDPQLIALLHGPGGSGKSTVINMVQAYAQSYCNTIGHDFTNRTILITAMSGVAATLLKGNTTHKVMGLNRGSISQEMKDEFYDARLLIIDEISFASAKDIEKLHQNCTELMQNHYATYGGLNVVFAGDFSQLKPVGEGKHPLYDDYCPAFHGKLNCFIELDGKWRFKDDNVWGEILLRFREGCPTLEDIRTINGYCNVSTKTPPAGVQVATFKNVNRDAVNSALFTEYCKENKPQDGGVLQSAVVILMDNLEMKNSRQTHVPVKSNAVKRHFYEHCGENDCDVSNRRGRIDPVLKVYYDCPLMLTQNKDVENGQANGSRVRLQSVTMKVGEEPFPLQLACGTIVRAVYASQVQCLEVKHEATDILPQTFTVNAEKSTFTSTIRIGTEECKTGMTGNQFPLISNSCTTGHKLQGCTCSAILVNEWFYGSNWPYVVLSRVRTMAGLYIMHDLDEDVSKYAMPKEMTRMIHAFRDTIALPDVTDEEYEELLKETRCDSRTPSSPVAHSQQGNTVSVTP